MYATGGEVAHGVFTASLVAATALGAGVIAPMPSMLRQSWSFFRRHLSKRNRPANPSYARVVA